MPPRSIGSAVALVSLAALSAIEAGGCDKRPESLRSATRSALPLFAQAVGSASPETNYALSDYGLVPRPGLKHVCGHYELRTDGKLTTLDLFVGSDEPDLLRRELSDELRRNGEHRPGGAPAAPHVDLVVDASERYPWPAKCPKAATKNTRSVLVATRVL